MSGRIVIRGATIPLSELSAPSKITVVESNITPPYLFKLEETMRFGLTFVTSENVNDGFDESLAFGDVLFQSENLQDQLAESITIENPPA